MAHERDASSEEEVMGGDLRRGPWTVEEDLLLVNYIAAHGEGRWNSLARSAGRIAISIDRAPNSTINYMHAHIDQFHELSVRTCLA